MKPLLTILLLSLCIQLFSQSYWEKYWDFEQHENIDSNGCFTEYYKSGNVKLSGEYKAGTPFGKWIFYDKKGITRIVTDYNGSHQRFLSGDFYGIGQKGNYKNGRRVGTWEEMKGSKISDNGDTIHIVYERYNFDTEVLELYRPYSGKHRKTTNKSSEKYLQREKNEGQVCYTVFSGVCNVSITNIDNNTNSTTERFLFLNTIGFGLDNNGQYNTLAFGLRYQLYRKTIENPFIGVYKGSNINFYLGYDIIRSRKIDLILLSGLSFLNYKLNEPITIKKRCFVPNFGISQKFNIQPKSSNYLSRNGFSFGFDVGYSLNIANNRIVYSKWESSFEGLYLYFTISYSIIWS